MAGGVSGPIGGCRDESQTDNPDLDLRHVSDVVAMAITEATSISFCCKDMQQRYFASCSQFQMGCFLTNYFHTALGQWLWVDGGLSSQHVCVRRARLFRMGI